MNYEENNGESAASHPPSAADPAQRPDDPQASFDQAGRNDRGDPSRKQDEGDVGGEASVRAEAAASTSEEREGGSEGEGDASLMGSAADDDADEDGGGGTDEEAADASDDEADFDADSDSDSDSDESRDAAGSDDGSSEHGDEHEAPRRPEPPPPDPDFSRLRKHHVAPAMIALDRIDDDRTFQIRPEGELSLLATDIARLGQLFPVDIRLKPPDRFQIICGFRRVAALRFLQRDRVLARLHTDLTDEDALLMALVSALHAKPVGTEELNEVKARLEREGRLSPAIRSMLEKALAPDDDLAPETVGDEIDAEELAQDVTYRLGEINQDLSLLADVFDSLDDAKKDQLLEQLRYSSELVTFLEGRR